MKKLFLIILSVTLVGCSNIQDIEPIFRNISFDAEMTYYNEYYEMKVDIFKTGDAKISFIHPKELEGLIFNYKNNTLTCEFNGINLDIADDYKAFAIKILYSAFKNENPTVFKNNESFYIEGSCDNNKYKMYITESGLPLKICDNADKFNVIIKNLTINKEKEP